MDTLQTQRNRRSPRVPNQPWRGPAGLTIAQMVALLAAVVLAVALWWVSGYLPGSAAFGVLAGRMIVTGFVGGIAAVLFYAAADPSREPFVRQQMLYPFHRHVYRKEPAHGTHAHANPIPFSPRRIGRPRAAGSRARPARARVAAAIHAIVAALPGWRADHGG
jgi:hypothetical protein